MVFLFVVLLTTSLVKYVYKSFLTTQSARCTVSGMCCLAVEPRLYENVIPHGRYI